MTSPSPSMDPDCRTFYRVKMFHSDVAICIDRVVFSPSRQKNEGTFFPSEQLLMAHLSLARQTPISSLSNYVRTYGARSLLPGSVCGLITRCMRARELLPSLLRPISERRREGGLDGGESVCLSVFAAATIPPSL